MLQLSHSALIISCMTIIHSPFVSFAVWLFINWLYEDDNKYILKLMAPLVSIFKNKYVQSSLIRETNSSPTLMRCQCRTARDILCTILSEELPQERVFVLQLDRPQ